MPKKLKRKLYTASSYKQELAKEMDKLKALMKKTWGQAPDVQATLEPCFMVRVDFNIKGFAHKGGKMYLSQKSMNGYRRPEKVVQAIAAEIASHRNTCGDCGEALPALWARTYHAERVLKGAEGNSHRYYIWPGAGKSVEKDLPLIPADAVERMASPRRAQKIDRAIKKLKA